MIVDLLDSELTPAKTTPDRGMQEVRVSILQCDCTLDAKKAFSVSCTVNVRKVLQAGTSMASIQKPDA
jgi:hypothetical protein